MIHPSPDAFIRDADLAALRRDAGQAPSSSRGLLAWTTAGAVALCLHIGLYLILTREHAAEVVAQQAPAAVMITLAPIPVTAKSEVDNTTQGPPADASEQALEKPVEEPPPPPDPIPHVEAPPPPPDVKPQAELPQKPLEEKKIEKEPPKEKPVEKKKPVQKKIIQKKVAKANHKTRLASRAAGGPRSDRQTADVTAASAAGAYVSEQSRASWQNEVRAQIVRAKRFPSDARGQVGMSVVTLTIGASGGASGVRLVASSGNPSFDAEAVGVMYRAAPYPQPPGGRSATLTVPLNFRR